MNIHLQNKEMELRDQLIVKSKEAHGLMVQQSKATWLKEWDDNTSYFHGLLKQRTYQTRIVAVTENDGKVSSQPQEVVQHILRYYEKLLGTRFEKKGGVREDVIALGNILSFPQQAAMIRPSTTEEVKAVVFAIHISKGPGFDGYNSAFFKTSWDVIGPEVSNVVLEFFTKGKLLKEINHTILVHLPKTDEP